MNALKKYRLKISIYSVSAVTIWYYYYNHIDILMALQRLISLIFCTILLLLMTGCSSSIWNRYPPPQVTTPKQGAAVGAVSGAVIGGVAAGSVAGAGIGALAGGVLGASLEYILHKHITLVERLQYNGVQVIELGNEIELILPTGRFFKPNSPLMNMQYYPVMNLVAKFIKQFPKISVKVAGYTDNQGAWQRNLVLSKSQAQTVMKYLWNEGIDTRLIYAIGYGDKDPIGNNATAKGRVLNNRIQISLRKISDYDDI